MFQVRLNPTALNLRVLILVGDFVEQDFTGVPVKIRLREKRSIMES